MQPEILAAIIALGGVFLSALLPYIISLRQTKIEFNRHSEQIKQEFSRRLFEKRMSVYPELYCYLSEFVTNAQFGNVTKQNVETLFSQLQIWGSKNAILFSAKSGHTFYHLMLKIFDFLKKPESEMQAFLENPDSRKQLIWDIQAVELTLKSELGIYAIESPTKIKDFTYYKTYKEVTDSIN